MGGNSDSNGNHTSLNMFVPPADGGEELGDDADAYLKRRQKKHQEYLRAARNAQKRIERLHQEEIRVQQLRKKST